VTHVGGAFKSGRYSRHLSCRLTAIAALHAAHMREQTPCQAYIGSHALNLSLKSAVRFSSSAGEASQFFQSARSGLPASAATTVRPKFSGNRSPRRIGCASCADKAHRKLNSKGSQRCPMAGMHRPMYQMCDTLGRSPVTCSGHRMGSDR